MQVRASHSSTGHFPHFNPGNLVNQFDDSMNMVRTDVDVTYLM